MNHQSQLRVPPIPWMGSCPKRSASGKRSPELTQRGGLSAAGRTDDQVPGELVDPLAAQTASALGLFEDRERLVETVTQGLHLFRGGDAGLIHGFRGRGNLLHELAIVRASGDRQDDVDECPDAEQDADDDPAT